MQTGKLPQGLAEQLGGDEGFVPPWQPSLTLRLGYARFKRYSEFLLAAVVGFSIGAFIHGPNAAKLGAIAAGVVISAILSWVSQRTLAKATEMQKQAIASMNITDLAVIDLSTGKLTPPKALEEKTDPDAKSEPKKEG